MLELRPNCELCDRDLPPGSADARICSYECTYCAACVETVLHNVCPTCGGNFTARPIRPRKSWRQNVDTGLQVDPPSTTRINTKYTSEEIGALVEQLRNTAPQER